MLHLCWNDCVAFCKWLTEKENAREGEAPAEPKSKPRTTAQRELPGSDMPSTVAASTAASSIPRVMAMASRLTFRTLAAES